MFKLLVDYPDKEDELEIIHRDLTTDRVQCVLTKDDIFKAQALVKQTYVDPRIASYIVDIVFATRNPQAYALQRIAPYIAHGVSPRATLALLHAAKAHAFIKRRYFVTPDDVKAVAPAILRHRLGLTYEAQAEEINADQLINTILNTITSP
jgi:MoxR-like ATPase